MLQKAQLRKSGHLFKSSSMSVEAAEGLFITEGIFFVKYPYSIPLLIPLLFIFIIAYLFDHMAFIRNKCVNITEFAIQLGLILGYQLNYLGEQRKGEDRESYEAYQPKELN